MPGVAAPLDEFIPMPDARERFEVVVDAPPELVFAVARDFDMQSLWPIRTIFRLREILTRSTAVHREPQGMLAELTSLGWAVLRLEPHRLLIGGAACQPWLANVVFRPIPPAEFRDFAEPDQVKIAWTIEVTADGASRTRLGTETRAKATDAQAQRRFIRYWRWARFGILPIRWLLLPAIGRKAEAEWRRKASA
jgi:hypothetical protein